MATLSDNVGLENMGQVMGVAMSFVTAGLISGPMVAGAMFQLVGYWPTWSVPLIVLLLDLIARLVMVENRIGSSSCPNSMGATTTVPSSSATETAATASIDEETAALISSDCSSYQSTGMRPDSGIDKTNKPTASHFYFRMLRDIRVLAAMATTMLYAAILSGFDSTLPLHLYRKFNWGSLPVGIIFLTLQLPCIFLGPVVGWWQDRMGLRSLSTAGWVLMCPLLWLLGIPGHSDFVLANEDTNAKAMFIFCMAGIGTVLTLVRNVGSLQMIGEFSVVHFHYLF